VSSRVFSDEIKNRVFKGVDDDLKNKVMQLCDSYRDFYQCSDDMSEDLMAYTVLNFTHQQTARIYENVKCDLYATRGMIATLMKKEEALSDADFKLFRYLEILRPALGSVKDNAINEITAKKKAEEEEVRRLRLVVALREQEERERREEQRLLDKIRLQEYRKKFGLHPKMPLIERDLAGDGATLKSEELRGDMEFYCSMYLLQRVFETGARDGAAHAFILRFGLDGRGYKRVSQVARDLNLSPSCVAQKLSWCYRVLRHPRIYRNLREQYLTKE
jgi:hypothetical protein